MKILWGEMIVAGSGKLGGHVQASNRAGPYTRTRVTPKNPRTPAQLAARATLAAFSGSWAGLLETERVGFNVGAELAKKPDRFGNIRKPTGINVYNMLNANLGTIGIPSISAMPDKIGVPEPIITGLSVIEATNVFDITFYGGAASADFQIWATPSLSPGKYSVDSFFDMVTTAIGTSVSPIDIDADYRAKFGDPVVGQKIHVKLVPVDNTRGWKGIGSAFTGVVA